MAKSANLKLKMLYLVQIFSQETDEDHGLTMAEIISRLADLGISADRKTLYLDFEELRLFGLDLVGTKIGRNTYYQLVSRDFEIAELKLLVDSVLSAKFITEKKSRELIKKLEGLVSKHEAKQLHRQVLISGRVKTMNESVYYNVDTIHTAINGNKQIKFKYFQWNVKKEEELRKNGDWYQVSPWHLRWDNENYYLIAYDEATDSVRHYRVDKMKNITVLEDDRVGQEQLAGFDAAKYTRQLFGMYGGDDVKVTLQGEAAMVNVIIDRFGKEVLMRPLPDGRFEAYVDVAVSPQFYGWVMSLGGGVRITAPETVVEEMRRMIATLAKQY